ncbi:prepilin-type N-terminal cleavage/methylation domain-containing protein [Halioglobus maricola]|uniref:Prepilin-type N-terminal cleavage/methylation domain-containing protein n=1 Tax=Halioglobus maricola TaxID=2601894 RepID=A0A5P9NLP6_9GAMM|nr:prepilin-type N-terminal cleavage/methylation domain-containing protein [Halioglobus maricola]QFU76707.1 prepilin-type N-terminal cleavage/methylation domain-containing protein [Halioglobus maricola]
MKPRKRASSGFTLVEVMVAISILSLVMLALVTGLRTLGNTQVALERKTERVDEIRTLSGFLRDLMEAAVVGESSGGLTLGTGGKDTTYFRLRDGGVEWKSTILFGEAYGGSHIVRLAKEGDALVLRWAEPTESGDSPDLWNDGPYRVLLAEVEEFYVEFRPEFTDDWVDRWEQENIAPALTRMQIKSSGRFWPVLIMQVQR